MFFVFALVRKINCSNYDIRLSEHFVMKILGLPMHGCLLHTFITIDFLKNNHNKNNYEKQNFCHCSCTRVHNTLTIDF